MNELNADGTDFIPTLFNEGIPSIIASYNKEEFKQVKTIPKTNYKYWKMFNGKKIYIE